MGRGNTASYIFFISFEIVIKMMVMNLFIAVVVEGYNLFCKYLIVLFMSMSLV